MPPPTSRAEIATRRIVQAVPGSDRVRVVRDVPYRPTADTAHTLDLYHPPNVQPGERAPAVLLVTGYRDAGMRAVLGVLNEKWRPTSRGPNCSRCRA